jgi:hypothetical protein
VGTTELFQTARKVGAIIEKNKLMTNIPPVLSKQIQFSSLHRKKTLGR